MAFPVHNGQLGAKYNRSHIHTSTLGRMLPVNTGLIKLYWIADMNEPESMYKKLVELLGLRKKGCVMFSVNGNNEQVLKLSKQNYWYENYLLCLDLLLK